MAESTQEERTNKTDEAYTGNSAGPRIKSGTGSGETVLPEVLEQPRNGSIAVGECVSELRSQHKASVTGKDVEDCRGHQAVARRKRSIRNLGDPPVSSGKPTGRQQNRMRRERNRWAGGSRISP